MVITMKVPVLKKILAAALIVLLAVVSFFPVAQRASSLETHAQTIASIDGKVETVLKLTATSTLASAAISAIPGDTATPISEKLADFTEYFLLILCVLYAEKYLLTIIGAGVFRYLIPLACVILLLALFTRSESKKLLARKLIFVSLALFLTIPASVRVSDMIYDTYKISIDETITATEQFTDETGELADAGESQSRIAAILDRLQQSANDLSDRAAKILNRFIEALAVMIVTSCIIPLLVLVFFVWLIKVLAGVEPSTLRLRPHKSGTPAADPQS